MPLTDIDKADVKTPKGWLARLGVLRLGWQEEIPGKDYTRPVKSDHFVMKDAPALVPVFGEEPRELPIRFPFKDFNRNIDASYKLWAGGIPVCVGDGTDVQSALPFTVRVDDKGATRVYRAKGDRLVSNGLAACPFKWGEAAFEMGDVVPCSGASLDLHPQCSACSPNIIIKIMINDVRCARWGYYQISTRSIRNYRHLKSVWASITDDGKLDIPMSVVPFRLKIVPGGTIYQGNDKSWNKGESFFLDLQVEPRIVEKLQASMDGRIVAMLEGRPYVMPTAQIAAVASMGDPEPEADEPAPPPWVEEQAQDDGPEEAQFEEVEPEDTPQINLDFVPEGIDDWSDGQWSPLGVPVPWVQDAG